MSIFNENGFCINSDNSIDNCIQETMLLINQTYSYQNLLSEGVINSVIKTIVDGIKKIIHKIADLFDTLVFMIKSKFDGKYYVINKNRKIIIKNWDTLTREEKAEIFVKYKNDKLSEAYDINSNMCNININSANDLNMKIANSIMELHGIVPMSDEIFKIATGYSSNAINDSNIKAQKEQDKLRGNLINCSTPVEKDNYEDCVRKYFSKLSNKCIDFDIEEHIEIATGRLLINIDKFKGIIKEIEREADKSQFENNNSSNNQFINMKLSYIRGCLNIFFIYSSYFVGTYKNIVSRSIYICEDIMKRSS